MRAALALVATFLLTAGSAAAGVADCVIPTPDSYPEAVAVAPDGHVWFTEKQANKIGRLAPSGHITEHPVPTTGGEPQRRSAALTGGRPGLVRPAASPHS